MASGENRDQRRHLTSDEAAISKLDPWLKQVKVNKTSQKELIEQASKIKVLNINQTSVLLDKPEDYLKNYQVHTDDVIRMIHEEHDKA